jgi:hypothetical protein
MTSDTIVNSLQAAGFSIHAVAEDVLLCGGKSGSFVLIVRRGALLSHDQLQFLSNFKGPSRVLAADGDPLLSIANMLRTEKLLMRRLDQAAFVDDFRSHRRR